MAGNKVKICPICGGGVIKKLWNKNFTHSMYYYMRFCNGGRELIPTVTPQEVR